MHNIYKVDDDCYQILLSSSGHRVMEGTLKALFSYTVNVLGFRFEEVERGVMDMCDKDCDTAHFGIHNRFIYSYNKKYNKAS